MSGRGQLTAGSRATTAETLTRPPKLSTTNPYTPFEKYLKNMGGLLRV